MNQPKFVLTAVIAAMMIAGSLPAHACPDNASFQERMACLNGSSPQASPPAKSHLAANTVPRKVAPKQRQPAVKTAPKPRPKVKTREKQKAKSRPVAKPKATKLKWNQHFLGTTWLLVGKEEDRVVFPTYPKNSGCRRTKAGATKQRWYWGHKNRTGEPRLLCIAPSLAEAKPDVNNPYCSEFKVRGNQITLTSDEGEKHMLRLIKAKSTDSCR